MEIRFKRFLKVRVRLFGPEFFDELTQFVHVTRLYVMKRDSRFTAASKSFLDRIFGVGIEPIGQASVQMRIDVVPRNSS